MYAGYQSFCNKHSSIHNLDQIPRYFFFSCVKMSCLSRSSGREEVGSVKEEAH